MSCSLVLHSLNERTRYRAEPVHSALLTLFTKDAFRKECGTLTPYGTRVFEASEEAGQGAKGKEWAEGAYGEG